MIQSSSLPYSISVILQQLGTSLCGALAYVGASSVAYKCPERDGVCRPSKASSVLPEGLIDYGVGVAICVNGKQGQGWRMIVAYEPSDVYTVYLWRKATRREELSGSIGVVLAKRSEVYGDLLAEVVEEMYDGGMKRD